MTTRRDISLNVIADISKYQEQFAKIPGYTDKQAAKAAQALEKRMSKAAADSARTAERAAEKAAREAAKVAAKAQREIIDTQREAIEAGKGLAELAGIPADKFEKLRAVMAGLSSPLGQIAVAGVGAALAVGAVATAVAGVSAAAVASVRASNELLDKFEALAAVEGFAIPAEDVESIRQANAALDSIQVTAERLVVIFAGQVAPSVQTVAVEIVKLGLAAGDVLDGMGSAATVVANVFSQMGRIVVGSISPITQTFLNLADISATLARAAGLDEMARKFERVANAATEIPLEVVGLGFEGISIATADYQERAEQLIGTVRKLAEEQEEQTKSSKQAADQTKKQADQVKALVAAGKERAAQVDRDIALSQQNAEIVARATQVELTAMGKLAKATDEQFAQAEAIRVQRLENAQNDQFLRLEAEREYEEARTAIAHQYDVQRTELARQQSDERRRIEEAENGAVIEGLTEFAQTMLTNTHQMLQGLQTLAADSKNRQRARALFQAGKVTGLGMVAVNTAVAITKAFADLGPILAPVAAGAIAANGIVQAEVIRRQKPPQFYRGTSMVEQYASGTSRVSGGTADAVPAVLHEGEAVLNRRAAERMGRGNIDAMNAGRTGGAPQVVAISTIGHRQFRDFYRDDRSLPGSLTRRDRNRLGTKIGRQL